MHISIPTLFKCDAKDATILHLNGLGVGLFQITVAAYVYAAPGLTIVAFNKGPTCIKPKAFAGSACIRPET
jgi:hypothetical protein